MSSLWTPEGEHRVPRPGTTDAGPATAPPARPSPRDEDGGEDFEGLDEEAMRAQMAELQERLADTPVEDIIANHAYGMFELAALHLSLQPPGLHQARLAIDAFGALVEGLGDRLGEHAVTLKDGLAQLRLAFVQLSAVPPTD
ncbi:MAG TPA: hypothetical protein VGS21_07765 [Acidimicrobiales bacterium]|nr:hypothetical protein [Acidimicrobiales bacterium]